MQDVLLLKGIYENGYGIISKKVMCSELPLTAKGIYAYICSYAGSGTTAFPTVEQIRGHLRISKDTFYTHLSELKDGGYIRVTPTYNVKNGTFTHNTYELISNPVPISEEERLAKKEAKLRKAAEKKAKKEAKKQPCPVEQDAVKHPCPVEQDAVKHPCPVEQDAVKHPCPVEQDTVEYPCPVHQDTVVSEYPICENGTKKPPTTCIVVVDSQQVAQKPPCPVEQDTNNNILKQTTTTNNKSSSSMFEENTLKEQNCQDQNEKIELENLFVKYFNKPLLMELKKELYSFCEKGITLDVIELAMKEAISYEKPTVAYLMKILNRYVNEGIYTLEDWTKDKEQHEQKRKPNTPRVTAASKFNTTYKHKWDLEEMEKRDMLLLFGERMS